MEATDNVTYFHFGLSFKLSADWMMLKRWLNRDECKYSNKQAALDSTQNRGITPERKVNKNVHPGVFSSQAIRAGADEHAAVRLTDQRWMIILHVIIKDTRKIAVGFLRTLLYQKSVWNKQ